ncbi:MAG: IS21 family transposase [Gemmatimonadetes bacterium]|nr:IS21 family transposase [Gemmatimonadota bacterium]
MRKVLDVLRLAYDQRLSQREIARCLALSQSTINEYLRRFTASGLPWPVPDEVDEAALEQRLFAQPERPPLHGRAQPDWAVVHQELRRTGVTLHLLWLEYKAGVPDGYQYTQFCHHYHTWASRLDPVLRQTHAPGERVFVDYAGPTIAVLDPTTGEEREAQLFVAVLGASNFLYAEATWTQTLPDWIASHVRMREYFGGVPALIVPDNLRAGVTLASYYEPEVNATYADCAQHYGTVILPARVAKPRDKAKVESRVQIAERWIVAPLRDYQFTSLAELNTEIARCREAINDRPFQKLDGTRRSLFTTVEAPALRPLPSERYELAEWRTATVNIDYHIAVERHFYSVPYPLLRATVRVRLTATMVEVLHEGRRVAAHVRSVGPSGRGRYTTDPAHRPKSHQAHGDWPPSRLIRWGAEVGPATAAVIQYILAHKPHPEQGYRACLGLFSLRRRYDAVRLEAACARARAHATGAISYRSVKSILVAGLDQLPREEPPPLRLPATHDNVRGPAYYLALDLPRDLSLTSGPSSC